ncbi:hypothetical protein COU91_01410 [Candidatus Saccharibacteria bacterium CG10_big_fil_rev_8_21_14_0_10_47_8]|nr:MAG: hypothetical protein COU91_01410 [Candidatus Saccharibacteria bacterium CG10_big_fil_rev_8_21_14_0_10_47_8]
MTRNIRRILITTAVAGSAMAIASAPLSANDGVVDAGCTPNTDQTAQPGGTVFMTSGVVQAPRGTSMTITVRGVAFGKDGVVIDGRQYSPGEEVVPTTTLTLKPGEQFVWTQPYMQRAQGRMYAELVAATVRYPNGKIEWRLPKPLQLSTSLGCVTVTNTVTNTVSGPTIYVQVPGPERVVYRTKVVRHVIIKKGKTRVVIRRIVVRVPRSAPTTT